MSLRDAFGGNRVYIIVAIFIIIVIVLAVLFSGRELFSAYVDTYGEGWSEIRSEWTHGSRLFGLESWNSFTYRNNNSSYPAYLTVTTMKNLFMKNENDLKKETRETILKEASKQNINIDRETEISGERALKDGHFTMYIIYNATLSLSEDITEQIRFIGETWNCDISGTSVICIGYAQVTNNSEVNLTYWAKIIGDKDGTFLQKYPSTFSLGDFIDPNGLIFNVKCH